MVYLNGRIQEIVSFIDSKGKTTVHRRNVGVSTLTMQLNGW